MNCSVSLFFTLHLILLTKASLDNQKIATAVSLISEYLIENSITFEVRIYESEISSDLREIATKTLRPVREHETHSGSEYKVVQVKEAYTEDEKEIFHLKTSAILIFDGQRAVRSFIRQVELKNSEGKLNFFVYYPNAKHQEIIELFPEFSPSGFQLFASFLIEKGNDDYLSLAVVSYFGSQPCRQPKIHTINKFSMEFTEWISTGFFPNARVPNYYGCHIVFEVPSLEKASNLNQFKIDVVEVIGSKLNFKPIFIDDGMQSIKADLELKSKPMMNKIAKEEFMTSSISTFDVLFIIPPGKLFRDEEKSFLHFDILTSTLLITTFLAAITVVLVVRNHPESVEERTLNLTVALQCVGEIVLPRRKHARYVLYILILYSLILR